MLTTRRLAAGNVLHRPAAGARTWWLEYRQDCEKASRPCAAIMHATASKGVFTADSCVRKKAGPRKPICTAATKLPQLAVLVNTGAPCLFCSACIGPDGPAFADPSQK